MPKIPVSTESGAKAEFTGSKVILIALVESEKNISPPDRDAIINCLNGGKIKGEISAVAKSLLQ